MVAAYGRPREHWILPALGDNSDDLPARSRRPGRRRPACAGRHPTSASSRRRPGHGRSATDGPFPPGAGGSTMPLPLQPIPAWRSTIRDSTSTRTPRAVPPRTAPASRSRLFMAGSGSCSAASVSASAICPARLSAVGHCPDHTAGSLGDVGDDDRVGQLFGCRGYSSSGGLVFPSARSAVMTSRSGRPHSPVSSGIRSWNRSGSLKALTVASRTGRSRPVQVSSTLPETTSDRRSPGLLRSLLGIDAAGSS